VCRRPMMLTSAAIHIAITIAPTIHQNQAMSVLSVDPMTVGRSFVPRVIPIA
jgi:hypothetical protein